MLTTTQQGYISICIWMMENPGCSNEMAATNFGCDERTIKRARNYGRSIGQYKSATGEKLRQTIAELTQLKRKVESQFRYVEKCNKHKMKKTPDPGSPDASGISMLARELRSIITTIAEMEGAYRQTISAEIELTGKSKGPIKIQIKRVENE